MLSPAGEVVQGFALRRVPFEGAKRNQKPLGTDVPKPLRRKERKNLLSLKAANSHLWWSGVALVVFMTVYWSDRFPTIDCSNSAAFLTAEQIFLKAWKARAFSFTPTYWGEPKNKPQKKGQFSAVSSSAVYFSFINV